MNDQLNKAVLDIAQKQNSRILGQCPLFLEMFTKLLADKKPVILVTQDPKILEETIENLGFFTENYTDLVKNYFANLFRISINELPSISVITPQMLITKIFCIKKAQKYSDIIIKNSKINRNNLISNLITLGYSKVSSVLDKATFAVRGSVIDIFNTTDNLPIRIDLFGDDIESIKHFEPTTQRSLHEVESVIIAPAREIIFDEESISFAQKTLIDLADSVDYPTLKLKEKISSIKNSHYFFGIEKLTPAFDKQAQSLLELVDKNKAHIIFDDKQKIFKYLENFLDLAQETYEKNIIKNELCFAPNQSFLSIEKLNNLLTNFSLLDIIANNIDNLSIDFTFKGQETAYLRQEILKESISTSSKEEAHLFRPAIEKIKNLHNNLYTVIIICSSLEQEQSLRSLLPSINLQKIKKFEVNYQKHVHAYTLISKHPPSYGSVFDFLKMAIIAPNDLFGKKTKKANTSGKQSGFKTTISDLQANDYIVHVDHGIGQFKGITRLNMHGVDSDYVLIAYQKDEKLYLPIHRINLIKPYQASSEIAVKLDKLGSNLWSAKKQKVKEAVISMAQELLNLYAKRKLVSRPKCQEPDAHFLEFESDFAFETTIDQQKAIEDVISDMQKDEPMDRLVCGDVGYGKTEVAMRASMLAILNNKTVAILAPTTVLAQQHGITFKERFSNTSATIRVLSRFQKPKEIKDTIKDLASNKVDIIIGTHRLLSPDVSIPNLGLLVIDEEQRFGIKSKEHIKKLKSKIDVLAMSATPIPRTMQMSYLGIRDLSIIETPPIDRLAIQTSICQFDDELIKEAIQRELSRGGQVYFVHNRVQNINAMADYLKTLVPQARINVAHGQMNEDELEHKMIAFMEHEIDILVCTTIIETGIDVSKANTMFINNADAFGLSQLYQLRGRIGRSNERAFAYLLIESKTEHLSDVARARLEILHRFSDLGSGFRIAQHDLELRGAGDLLGKSQHGHMTAIGYDLYAELLQEAVKELQGQNLQDDIEPEVSLPIHTFIPEKYCPDLQEKMTFYQKIATASNSDKLEQIFYEMEDIYGDLPLEVIAIKTSSLIKFELKKIKALSLKAEHAENKKSFNIIIALSNNSPINTLKIVDEIKKSTEFKITPQHKIIQNIGAVDADINNALFNACNKAIQNIIEKILN